MRGKRQTRLVIALVVALGGCWSEKQTLRPPPPAECYTLPPADDARFSAPIEYPRGTLNNDLIKKPKGDPMQSTRDMQSSGAGGSGGSGY